MFPTQTTSLFDEMLKTASDVDFRNVPDATAYASLILAVANEIGLILPTGHRQSYEAIQTIRLAKEWIYNVKANIDHISPGDAMDILEPFDFIYRLAHRSPIPREFADKYLLQAFDAHIHGDNSVDPYHLFRFIRTQLKNKNRLFFSRPLDWYSATIDRWYTQFRSGHAPRKMSDYDTLETISLLLTEDIFAFAGSNQEAFKQQLFDSHSHLFDRISDYTPRELVALSHFLSASRPYLAPSRYLALSTSLTSARSRVASPFPL